MRQQQEGFIRQTGQRADKNASAVIGGEAFFSGNKVMNTTHGVRTQGRKVTDLNASLLQNHEKPSHVEEEVISLTSKASV